MLTDPASASRDGYQWLRDGQPISGAISPTYTATTSDVGHALSLQVQVSAAGYTPATLTSPPIDGIEDADTETFDASKPVIVGKVRSGQKVAVEVDEDAYDKSTTLKYQWLLGGKPAKKGTGATFKILKKYRGMALSVQVTASAPGYETETVTSRRIKIKR